MSWWNRRGGIKGLLMNTCTFIVFTLAFIKYTDKGNVDMLCYSLVVIHEFCLSTAPAKQNTYLFFFHMAVKDRRRRVAKDQQCFSGEGSRKRVFSQLSN
jgi:hypothetical protein